MPNSPSFHRLVLAVVLLSALVGCSSPTAQPPLPIGSVEPPGPVLTGVPQETATEPPAAAAPSPTATQAAPRRTHTSARAAAAPPMDRFVAAVHRDLPEVALDRRDDELADLGSEACEGLAAGKRSATVAGGISEYGVSATDARTLVDLARRNACTS